MDLIAAVDENWGLGKDNGLLFHISPDLKRFKALTQGHAVVMGRRTLLSLPHGAPLPNRRNLVLSHTPGYTVPGAEVCATLEELLARAPADAFVIGGASVYRALLPFCTRAYLTRVSARAPADCFLPDLDADPAWQVESEEPEQVWEGLRYRFVNYVRRAGPQKMAE